MTAVGSAAGRYTQLRPDADANELEEAQLARWSEEGLLDRIDAARVGAPEWVFFEGPPTANGRPGVHHVLARTIKDLFCRHRVMRGFHVLRKAGWDTHGLPVEIEVEKQLGISGKGQIEEYGVERFNQLCRESVWRYKDDWEKLSARIGYDLDYRTPYVTYSHDYVESVWWALRTLHDRGLLYRGHKILPYCPRCGTALSSHEVALGYETVHDPSVYIALELADRQGGDARRILVWTTTPWTLVSNVALAVNPELTYLELRPRDGDDARTVILAESRAGAVLGEDFTDRWTVVARFAGSDLAGQRYRRPLDWVPYGDGEHELIVAESFVSADDGSGVVHMAPAFGEDDYAAGKRHGLAFLQPVDGRGEFVAGTPVVAGLFFKAADAPILAELKKLGALWKAGTLEHPYPHCWRCRTPLLYYARGSWFVRTTAYRDQMLARNARVTWQPPKVGEGRFGEWLKNNIDWALSRDRYWGTPLPLWVCDADSSHVEAIGGYAELGSRVGEPLPPDFDPHKPHVDRYTWRCGAAGGACGGMMRRVPEVIDTWFDSGSMPFAQWHYPFENADIMARQYPADFIAEGVDQTRGWFYSLLAIATGLGDALPNNDGAPPDGDARAERPAQNPPPYRAVVVNDQVLDAHGQKMSKSRGNAVAPWEVIGRHGADAVRIFLVASSQVWQPRRFDEDAIREVAGRFLLTLKNTYSGMFAQYANFGWTPGADDPVPAARPPADRWVLSRLAGVEWEADRELERFEPTVALRAIMDFVVDDVSNWYVRLSRARFYDVDGPENRAAFATLHEVLVVVCRLLAPFAPFLTDWMHRELTGDSVHLASYRRDAVSARDHALEGAMAHVRALSTLGRAAREEANVRVRQPLGRLVCVVPGPHDASLDELVPYLRNELNVKDVEFASSSAEFVRLEGKANFRALGKRFGKRTPLAAHAVSALSEDALRAFERGDDVAVWVEGESHMLTPDDLSVVRRAAGELVVKEEGGYVAALDPAITPALRREGLAREIVSRLQRMRKEAGLEVSDRVTVIVAARNAEIAAVVGEFQDYISSEVLAAKVELDADIADTANATQAVDLDGIPVTLALTRVD
ncbi:MAG: isoleucine--tRNA ligase [Gemmatimonadaceae bacterium]